MAISAQENRKNASLGLMGGNIIGFYLSNELQCDSSTTPRHPKLRCFIHHEEQIQCSRLVGKGEHGVVLLATIIGSEYAIKVVSLPATY